MSETDYSNKHVEFEVPEPTPEEQARLDEMYKEMEGLHTLPLWRTIGNLMPNEPTPQAVAHKWDWSQLSKVAEQAGELVPVGRGGERRAIGLCNPGLGGNPYVSPTLWAAIQYLGPGENAPEHRHSQNAFRFVTEGEGVWTVVNGDAVPMKRGDFLITPGWAYHGHHNIATEPMIWIDGLDIPFQHVMDTGFFEYGSEKITDDGTPDYSRMERLWAHPGLRPVSYPGESEFSPIGRFAWEHTDAALNEQLALENEGYPGVVSPGHAAIRYSNPTNGADVMNTVRAEFHRLRPEAQTIPVQEVGSRVFQVFEGTATITIGEKVFELSQGDMTVVPSWQQWHIVAGADGVDLFCFSDHPIFEKLGLARTFTPEGI